MCNIVNGFTPKRDNPEFWTNGDIPWFTVADIHTQGRFINRTEQYITEKAVGSKDSERIVPPNSILICCTASVGEYAYTNIALTTNQQFNALIIKDNYKDILYSIYLYYFSLTLKKTLLNVAGKTTFSFISVAKLSNVLIPIPPLEEQHRIVAKIEELLPFVDRYAEAYEKLEKFNAKFPEDMKKSILQYAIQGKLVEQRAEEGTAEELYQQIQNNRNINKIKKNKKLLDITEDDYLFDIPNSWKWVRIGDIFQTSSGTTPLKSNHEYYDSFDYNWIRTTDLNNGILTQGEVKISKKAKEECNLEIIPFDSVCLAMYGGGGTIGKNALIHFDTTINQSVCAIHPNGFCDMKYLLYYMQFFRPLWMNYAAGSRKDPNINQIIINNAVFPLPPIEEQKRIVAKIEELLPYCDQLIK